MIELTNRQSEYMEMFLKRIKNNEIYLIYSKFRKFGKTTIIRELGLHLQSLGYNVAILTIYNQDYYAHKPIDNINDLRGYTNTVVLVDTDEFRVHYDVLQNIKEYCNVYTIPMVGFVSI